MRKSVFPQVMLRSKPEFRRGSGPLRLRLLNVQQRRGQGMQPGDLPEQSCPINETPKKAQKGHRSDKRMGSTLTNLLYHIVFSTKNREPIIPAPIRKDLYA